MSSKENGTRAEAASAERGAAPPPETATDAAPSVAPAATPQKQKRYIVTPHPGPSTPVPTEFAEAVLELQKHVPVPIWLLIHGHDSGQQGQHGTINSAVRSLFFSMRHELPQSPVAILVESPGGYANCAYQIAKVLRKRCSAFVVIVPRYAKSAATLFSLGAAMIVLGDHAELGPLDAQLLDFAREQQVSALEEVQALERLNSAGLLAAAHAVRLLAEITHKRTDVILPAALKFVADIMRPLYEHIDVAQYSQRSRVLKVAEDYAVRLLTGPYSPEKAQEIAGALVQNYPDHNFAVDFEEAQEIGLNVSTTTEQQQRAIDKMIPYLKSITAIGQIREVT